MRGVAVEEPFQFLPRFLVCPRPVGEVATDLRIAIEGEEFIEVAWKKTTEEETFTFEEDHFDLYGNSGNTGSGPSSLRKEIRQSTRVRSATASSVGRAMCLCRRMASASRLPYHFSSAVGP